MERDSDKFSDRARKVLALAQEEALRFRHSHIGTEHLLLGLVREGEGVGARVLAHLGVQLPKVRSAIEFLIERGEGQVDGDVGLTRRSRRALEYAAVESRNLNHVYIGTEHVLLGLVREGEGIAAGVLESFGVTLDNVRIGVLAVLAQPPSKALGPFPVDAAPQPARQLRDGTDEQDVALLTVALRLARKREDREKIARIRVALESAELRRLVGLRTRARDRLVDAERRRIELMTKIASLERDLQDYDRQIAQIRAEFARRSDEEPPDFGVGARVRR